MSDVLAAALIAAAASVTDGCSGSERRLTSSVLAARISRFGTPD